MSHTTNETAEELSTLPTPNAASGTPEPSAEDRDVAFEIAGHFAARSGIDFQGSASKNEAVAKMIAAHRLAAQRAATRELEGEVAALMAFIHPMPGQTMIDALKSDRVDMGNRDRKLLDDCVQAESSLADCRKREARLREALEKCFHFISGSR